MRLRILSALVLGPVVLGTIWTGHVVFPVLVGVATIIAVLEWTRLTAKKLPLPWASAIGGLVVASVAMALYGTESDALWMALGLFVAVYAAARLAEYDQALTFAFGVPYLALAAWSLLWIRSQPDVGLEWSFLLFGAVWATDIGAYVFGRYLGGPKLAPQISPMKTWAGGIGGAAMAMIVGIGIGLAFGDVAVWHMVLLAAVISVAAQFGDLFISILKRRSGTKDTGTLIPGHGGLLDRIDGLIAAAIVLGIGQYFAMRWGTWF